MEEEKNINVNKSINDNLKEEYINLSIDENTKNIIGYYFDGKFTSDQMIDYVKNEYSKFEE